MYADRRLRVLFLVTMLLVSLAGLRSVWFAIAKADTLRDRARGQQVIQRDVLAMRGEIVDRNGVPLAVTEPAADVSVSPQQVEELRRQSPGQEPIVLARLLSKALGVDQKETLEKITSRKQFVYIGLSVPDTKIQRLRDLAARKDPRTGQRTANLVPVHLEPRNRRIYPNQAMAGQLLGGYGDYDKPLGGLETSLNDTLRGKTGKVLQTQAGSGSALSRRVIEPTVPGKDVELTLDARIQAKAEEALQELGQTYRPKRATAIVMRPDGEVLSMANWPRIDPNDPGGSPTYALQNTATNFNYEPGSTFKALAVAGALQDRVVTPETTFTVPYQIQVADRTIADSHPHGTETMTPGRILSQSSNVGAIQIGMRLNERKGKDAFDRWMRRFGFGSPSGIGLGEEQGLLLPVDQYSGSTMGNLPIGQGQMVTPIQIASLYATIAGNGMRHTPHLVRKVAGKAVEASHGKRVLRPAVAKEVAEMLSGVFEPGGTASAVKVPGYTLAGKTGTSNVVDPDTGEYVKNRNVASIAGFAPAKDPKVVIVVVAEEPEGGGYGSTVAGPAFADIARFVLQYQKIPPS
ncbi:MAG: peptidoglycan D,D-transpeptidase FtsI family protein [Solirubrobacteraceae bacterium]